VFDMKKTKLIVGVLAALFIVGALFTSATLLKSNDVKAENLEIKTTSQAGAGACGCGCGGTCGGECGVEGCSCGKGP
jgi:hypothetical protein